MALFLLCKRMGENMREGGFFNAWCEWWIQSGSPTTVPCSSFLESVPGVCGVKKFMVASESKIPKTVFCMVILEVSSLQLNVKLFNVRSGHRHRQRPTSARCFYDLPMMLAQVACSL